MQIFNIMANFFTNSLTREMIKANFISHILVDFVYYLSISVLLCFFQYTDHIGDFNKEMVIIL